MNPDLLVALPIAERNATMMVGLNHRPMPRYLLVQRNAFSAIVDFDALLTLPQPHLLARELPRR